VRGGRRPPPGAAGVSAFFEGVLLLAIGKRVAWTGHLQALLGTDQVPPAEVRRDGVAQPGTNPGGSLPPSPKLVARCRHGHYLTHLLLQQRRDGGRGAMRRRVSAIVHARWAFGVVALGDLADPIRGVARDRRHRRCGVALAEQPEDLPRSPPAALIGFVGRPVPTFQRVGIQMRVEMEVSGHAPIVQPPTTKRMSSP
jgi:hypothetical protein